MMTVLTVLAYFLVCLSYPSPGQSIQIGTLNNFTVFENATHLTLYWLEPQEAPSFSNYFVVYEQADPNHDINSDYVSSTDPNLLQDGSSKTYTISKAHLVEGGYFGPLLIHVSGHSLGAGMTWYTEELLYNPAETDQSSVNIMLKLYWSENSLDCEAFMGQASADSIATELEYVIRKQALRFHLEGKIDNSNYFCENNGAVFQAVLHAAGNATEYKVLLYDWLRSNSSYMVLRGYRYNVSERYCGMHGEEANSADNMGCESAMEQIQEGVSEQGKASSSGNTALIVAFISLAMNAVLVMAAVVYILLDKCACHSHRTTARHSSSMITMKESANGKGTVQLQNEEEAIVNIH